MVTPYDEAFFERERADSAYAAERILPVVLGLLGRNNGAIDWESPLQRIALECTSVVDVGCGAGQWTRVARERGLHAIGIDGPWAPGADIKTDLAVALPKMGTFSLAICLEVAEHVPPMRGASLVAELCLLAPVILWSAATPGQMGEGHINEQPERYWERLFARHGRSPDRWLRSHFEADLDLPVWYRRNIMIYA